MNPHLKRLARRVTDDPSFLAAALQPFADSESLDPAGLGTRLGCPASVLPQVYLCLMPRSNAPYFWQDIEQIATRFALNPDALGQAVRRGQSLIQMRQPDGLPASGSQGLVAARERREPPPSDGSKRDKK